MSKIFRFGKDRKVEILADILNVLNDTAEEAYVSRNLFSPNLGKPSRFVDSLGAMIGIKFSF